MTNRELLEELIVFANEELNKVSGVGVKQNFIETFEGYQNESRFVFGLRIKGCDVYTEVTIIPKNEDAKKRRESVRNGVSLSLIKQLFSFGALSFSKLEPSKNDLLGKILSENLDTNY